MTQSTPDSGNPRVGITVGDAAGIGPEVALKALASEEVRSACRALLFCDARELSRQAAAMRLECDYPAINHNDVANNISPVAIVDLNNLASPAKPGETSAAAGRAAAEYVASAVSLCRAGALDAIATAPINKAALRLAGMPFEGHTEMLASLCGADRCLMSFFAGPLRVVLLTTHVSLGGAIGLIKKDHVVRSLVMTAREIVRFGTPEPRIALAGLNPHAGESGLFGAEDRNELVPAVQECRESHGINVTGPLPADTLFVRAWRGEFDCVVACYHDQAMIAVKCLAFGKAVGVTLGLPIVRTSVDHGTAFDIAGRGIADAGSMIEAIKTAADLARLNASTCPVAGRTIEPPTRPRRSFRLGH
ncbi:MAG TPA: 4-hydroxythreonine-4-phosphate dehydrogenase PdxA [Blastocatellia bacterium]|nr:4-hydroxythreonine-4-phosphate dehydrogenase PdxA [Blastocatellia bacterium]